MKNGLFIALALVGLTCGMQTAGAQQNTQQVRKELEAEMTKVKTAYLKKDVKTLIEHLTPDAQVTFLNGRTLNRSQIGAYYTKGLALLTLLQASATIDQLSVRGNTATFLSTQAVTASYRDKKGHQHILKSTAVSEQHCIKTAQGWKANKIKEKSQKAAVDGKPVRIK